MRQPKNAYHDRLFRDRLSMFAQPPALLQTLAVISVIVSHLAVNVRGFCIILLVYFRRRTSVNIIYR
jgi:hypothetical protein